MDEAAKANTITLEEFLEVEVRFHVDFTGVYEMSMFIITATQTWIETHTCKQGNFRQVEAYTNGQEGS